MTQPTKGPHNVGTPGTKIQDHVFASDRRTLLGMAWSDTDPRDIETGGRLFVSADEAAANARLWATAWELLEVCKAQAAVEVRVHAMNQVNWNAPTPEQITEAEAIGAEVRRIKALRAAAIAKATGETP